MMIAQRFPLVGLAIAGVQLTTTIGRTAFGLWQYLLKSPETAAIRTRATMVAVLALIVLPISTCFIPMPFGVVAQGVVAAQTEYYLNAETPGSFTALNVSPGDFVEPEAVLASLSNPLVVDQHHLNLASLQEALLQWEVTRNQNLVEAAQYEPRIRELKHQVLETQRQVASLQLSTPGAGLVARVLPQSQNGRFVGPGETAAIVVNGRPLLRTWLTEDQLGSINRTPGTPVEFRIPGQSARTHSGRLLKIEPASESSSLSHALTFMAGGEIIVDPQTGLSIWPLFQIDIEPEEENVLQLSNHGMRVSLKLPRRKQSIAGWIVNRLTRFVNKTLMA
jgi:putative peptide zinc metalloprotease protein